MMIVLYIKFNLDLIHWLFLGQPEIRKLPGSQFNWTNEQKRAWLSKEIDEFLKEYVYTESASEMEEFVSRVNELDTQRRDGYPCRECGQIFSYHSTGVEYVD